MENISLMIVTDDMAYGKAFGNAVQYLCRQIIVQLLRKDAFFMEKKRNEDCGHGMGVYESADLILWDGAEAESAYGGRIVLLSNDPTMTVKDFNENKFCLYKYSQAQSMIASIFEIYSALIGRRVVDIKRRNVSLLVFCSGEGGSGCTTLAMAAAQELCRFYDQRVLYLSFESIESTGNFIATPVGVKGVGVYLYHLFKDQSHTYKVNAGGSFPVIEGYLVQDDFGVEAFASTAGRNPVRELRTDELDTFIASLIDCGRYDVILIDIGNNMTKIDLSCIEMAEKICLICKDNSNKDRENSYIRHMVCCCGENIADKIIKIENMVTVKCSDKQDQYGGEALVAADLYISKSELFLQRGEVDRIFLDGEFGRKIKLLAEKLTQT